MLDSGQQAVVDATPFPSLPTPESLFARWLAHHAAGQPGDLARLCERHPEHAERLRELHRAWGDLQGVLAQAGLGSSLAERLETRYGSDVDPRVTLEAEGATATDVSAEVLTRLAGRGPASTRYRIQGEVAHGGMGAVLRVWDEDLRRPLAMKVILGRDEDAADGDVTQVDPGLLARFLEEAQVTGQLDHPGIVPVHELGLDADGRVYFTMKLVKGRTLRQVLEELARGEGGWTQTRVLGILLKVCEAMSYAHAKGVIHRDLKPANIMVGRFGEVYVMDWGLARVLAAGPAGEQDSRAVRAGPVSAVLSLRRKGSGSSASSLETLEGDILGTPAYMSPEQAHGRLNAVGPPSDVYAVGAMLYQLLAGRAPPSPLELRAPARVPALHEVAPGTPPELEAICERAMALEPGDRFADMSALAADLSAYLEGRVVRAYETGAWAEARKWVRRNRPLATALAAAVVLLVAGLVSSLLLKAQSDANAARADAKAREAGKNLELAERNAREAEEQRRQALHARDLAEAETAKVLRLSDVKVLQELEVEADALWPPYPAGIPALEAWRERAARLLENLPRHRATLTQMRGHAQAWTDEERARDRRTHPRAAELAGLQSELAGLVERVEAGPAGEERDAAERRIAELEPQVSALEDEVAARRTWRLDGAEQQWQHDLLGELVAGLEGLEAGLLRAEGVLPGQGWGVPRRIAFARELEAGFAEGGSYSRAWTEARAGLRRAYPGLELQAQMGLVPLGPDPATGLWEFAHLSTGEPARRGADGALVLAEETGLVLVLLPGGSFRMGAQSSDPAGENFDPGSTDGDEAPVHPVELSPFFLSKYEMTQGQWLRLTGANPSALANSPLAPTLLHPVEQISWRDCSHWLPRAGLTLPSEAQWEYAARGGRPTPWWTGAGRDSLLELRAGNLADQAAARMGAPWAGVADWPELDDGYAVHAPVDAFAANPFGLHGVVGNVWEWCRDAYDRGFYASGPRLDPVAPAGPEPVYVVRGGSYGATAAQARSAARDADAPNGLDPSLGVRPARPLER